MADDYDDRAEYSEGALNRVTLAAWGAHGSLLGRSAAVVPLLPGSMFSARPLAINSVIRFHIRAGTDLRPHPAVDASE